jgi:hypothetical protein
MSNIIGMLVLVDSAALIKDHRIQAKIKSASAIEKAPVFTLNEEDDFSSYIYMMADRRHVVDGQGTNNLTVKAAPGDKLRWWGANIYQNSPFEIMIKEVSPAANRKMNWQEVFHQTPALHPDIEKENPSTIGLIGRDLFWTAAFADFRYQTQIKEDTLLSEPNINLDYHIDLQIMDKTHPEEKPVCIFRWFPKIQLQEAS